jgi:hypothetical protein
MEPIASDTTIEAAAVQLRVLRRIGIEGRAKMTFQLSNNMRSTVEAGVRHRHPEYDDRQVRREVLRLMIGDKLYRLVVSQCGDRI